MTLNGVGWELALRSHSGEQSSVCLPICWTGLMNTWTSAEEEEVLSCPEKCKKNSGDIWKITTQCKEIFMAMRVVEMQTCF